MAIAPTIDEREQNLYRATDALAQFYGEIESFLNILFTCMTEHGYTAKTSRLRAGTFTVRNLHRRLLAAATLMYFRGEAAENDEDDAHDEEEEEAEEKAEGRLTVEITPSLRVPFAMIWLFPPKATPTVRNLTSPRPLVGAIGNFRFCDKDTEQKVTPPSTELGVIDLAQLSLRPNSAAGTKLTIKCHRPKVMKKYLLQGEIVACDNHRLMEVDSQDKIQAIADKLSQICKPEAKVKAAEARGRSV